MKMPLALLGGGIGLCLGYFALYYVALLVALIANWPLYTFLPVLFGDVGATIASLLFDITLFLQWVLFCVFATGYGGFVGYNGFRRWVIG